MALKIVKSSDPLKVERLNVVIYAQPGVGKTSIAFTASNPLLLDFDGGAYRAAHRKDSVQVSAWSDVTGITADDLASYSTVIVDTAGRALDMLSADIIKRDPKKGRGGVLSLQGYGALKAEFGAWLKHLNSMHKDVILIAHMDEQRNGDDIIERLDVQGGSKGEIYKLADAMGRIFIRSGQHVLDFTPREGSFGKNPGQLEPLSIPHPDAPQFDGFLAGVIQQIKDKLNAMTAEQLAAEQALQTLRDKLADATDAGEINSLLTESGDNRAARALVHAKAKALGLAADTAAGCYREREAA